MTNLKPMIENIIKAHSSIYRQASPREQEILQSFDDECYLKKVLFYREKMQDIIEDYKLDNEQLESWGI